MMLTDHQHQDIARSSYADMLNDDERNRAYDNAIRICVANLVRSQKYNPHSDRFYKCCDIGTGSGLLSMMIVRAFRELNYDHFHVQAFEAFQPMAECAKRVIEQNGMSDFITVIPTRSDQCRSTDESPQFDLLVAELLDTELIGEGCLEAYRHAVQNLCSPACLFVPHAARIYLEPVASTRLFGRHAIGDLRFDLGSEVGRAVEIACPEEAQNCHGMPEIDDMQVGALREGEDFTRFSRPQVVFEFIFGKLDTLKLSDHRELKFDLDRTIDQPPVAIMWWDIVMYEPSLEIPKDLLAATVAVADYHPSWQVLSCAPTWARCNELLERDQFIKDTYKRDVWREHWIQGVYYFGSVRETRELATVGNPKISQQQQQQHLTIHAYHDSYSLWFDLKPCETKLPSYCDCGAHRKLTRSQLAFLNDSDQMAKLLRSIILSSAAASVNLAPPANGHRPPFVQDPSVSPAAPIRGQLEFQRQASTIIGDTVSTDRSPKWRIRLPLRSDDVADDGSPGNSGSRSLSLVDLALADEIPWSNIMMNYLDGCMSEPIDSFVIKFTQVQFDNLNRIRTDIRECEGFNLSALDDMINHSSKYVDKELEAHYLWEYPCTRIDSDQTVFCSSSHQLERDKILAGTYWRHFKLPVNNVHADGQLAEQQGASWKRGWALAFWVELKLKHTGETLSLGPTTTPTTTELGKPIEWNRNSKQLVYFLHDHPPIGGPQSAVQGESSPTPAIHLDIGLRKFQLTVQRAVDYNTSPLKSRRNNNN